MDTKTQSLALCGVVGGAGTTRLTLELGATLARGGHDVVLLDAAYGTQGLARYVSGPLETDVTDAVTGEKPIEAAIYDLPLDLDGRLSAVPSHATFEQLARAKAPAAAEQLSNYVTDLTRGFDIVLIDTPPLATNPAVAAVTAADAVALVAPATERGLDAISPIRGRLQDVGASGDHLLANRADGSLFARETELLIPESANADPDSPTCATAEDGALAPSVVDVAETLFDTDLGIEFEDPGLLEKYSLSR
ncbi:AAA family ATPase [Haladaptatus sp. DJG-WS-42]|uniref:MinD/ParA family ATP-binding protein n=1 Tax=Haladaptatus sp. DJG-WS-42 TaxID=3120516 RepID=UPI0030D5DC89